MYSVVCLVYHDNRDNKNNIRVAKLLSVINHGNGDNRLLVTNNKKRDKHHDQPGGLY